MIAVFDSGYGGLTVLKPLLELLPEYDYLYLGDNARAPYGNRSQETIKRFCEEAVEFLFSRGVVLIIFACNTASSFALRAVQKKYLEVEGNNRKILGVIIPKAEEVVRTTHNKRVGLVGTRATIKSHAYEKELKKLDPEIKLYSKACPLIVPFVEENWHHKPEAISILKKYLKPLKSCNIDTLLLGCTHYPFMIKEFKKVMGKSVKILTSGEVTAKSLKKYLQAHPEIEEKITRNKTRKFLTTGNPQEFKDFTEKNLGLKIKTPEYIQLP